MIVKQYYVRVDFEYGNNYDHLDDALVGLSDDAEVFTGNPACYPYVYGSTPTMIEAEEFERRAIALILKYGGRVL